MEQDLKTDSRLLWESVGLSADHILKYDFEQDIMYAECCRTGFDEGNIQLLNFSKNLERYYHHEDIGVVRAVLEKLPITREKMRIEARMLTKKGMYTWVSFRMRTIFDEKGMPLYAVGSVYDIQLRKENELWLEKETRIDSLTGIYNKRCTQDMICEYLKQEYDRPNALLIVDIDNFKRVNDTLGHLFGDEVLCDVANALAQCADVKDIYGRIGGDEFMLLLKDTPLELAIKTAEEINEEIRRVYLGRLDKGAISASIGIAMYPDDGMDFEKLYQCADRAAYYVKDSGKNGVAAYSRIKDVKFSYTPKPEREIVSDMRISEVNKLMWQAFGLLSDTRDMGSTVNLLLKRMVERYDVTIARLYENVGREHTLTCTYEWKKSYIKSRLDEVTYFSRESWDDKTNYAKNVDYIREYSSEEYLRFYADDITEKYNDLKSMLSVALYINDTFLGAINFYNFEKKNVWTDEQKDELRILAKIISIFLYNSRQGYIKNNSPMDVINDCDGLTGLYKVEKFVDLASKYINGNQDKHFMIVCSDISNFKYMNDVYGTETGDRILKTWADMVRNCGEGFVYAARLYSDLFIMLMELENRITDELAEEKLFFTKEYFEKELGKKFKECRFVIAAGGCLLEKKDESISFAISNANMARKIAKASDIRKCRIYDEAMRRIANQELAMVANIDKALANQEFVVYLQPKVRCRDGSIIGAEALVRWRKSDGTIIYPNEFIPAFEKNGCIVQMDYYVYEEVFRYLKARLAAGLKAVPISVNISRAHVANKNLIYKLEELFEQYPIPVSYIELELTETIYIENLPKLMPILEFCKQKGIKVSIDDFGSGYSSLNMLATLSVDTIKLDKVFMKRDGLSEHDKIVVSAIVELAKRLNLEVLCEGVENEEQNEYLNEIGCDAWQGYLCAKPMSITEYNEFLEKR